MSDTYTKFRDMEPGVSCCRPVLVVSMEDRVTLKGKPFVALRLSDGDSEINANIFDATASRLNADGVEIEQPALAGITFRPPYYNIDALEKCAFPVSTDDFIRTAPIDIDKAYDEMIRIISSSHSTTDDDSFPLCDFTQILIYERKEAFKHSSAAKAIHHNLKGGLLYHSYRMVKAAEKICDVYTSLDKELLVCGAALHDIGKVIELDTNTYGNAEYSVDGRLEGHALIGVEIIDREGREWGVSTENLRRLKHLIASHHGKLEHGAITTPALPEAAALHALDMLDSRQYMFEDAYSSIQPGELSGKVFGLENSTVYLPVSC